MMKKLLSFSLKLKKSSWTRSSAHSDITLQWEGQSHLPCYRVLISDSHLENQLLSAN